MRKRGRDAESEKGKKIHKLREEEGSTIEKSELKSGPDGEKKIQRMRELRDEK